MRELSLFSGAGGGLLGTKLLGFNHIGYVEYNDYCQKIIKQRIIDGILDDSPIFGDIKTFISEGYAASYKGLVDVITAGFPCQPFSVAGKQKGADDDRNMWPQTIDTIRIVRPEYVLLENVPGLLAHEYARTIFRDLAESGYECRWRILSAAEMGAPHKRDRIFILCHAKHFRRDASKVTRSTTQRGDSNKEGAKQASESQGPGKQPEELANASRERPQRQRGPVNGVCTKEEGEREADKLITNSGWSIKSGVG